MTDERRLGEIVDYDGFIAAIVARMTEIGITHEGLEALGFAKGHIGKLLAPNRSKVVGPKTFGPIMELLGMKLVAVEDVEGTKKMRPHWTMREKALPMRTNARNRGAPWLFTPRSGRDVRNKHLKKLSKAERSQIGARLAQARWKLRRLNRAKKVARAAGKPPVATPPAQAPARRRRRSAGTGAGIALAPLLLLARPL